MDSNSRLPLFILCLALAPALSAQTGQELVVKNNDLALPPMYEETTMTNSFTVSNASDQQITITGVRPTCGCTFARAETNVVEPHRTTKIIFGYRAGRAPGATTKRILLSTSTSQVYLGFTANVKPILTPEQTTLDLGVIARTNAKILTRELSVSAADFCTNVSANSLTYNSGNMKIDWSWDRQSRVLKFRIEIDTTKYADNALRDGFSVNLLCGEAFRQYYFPIVGQFR